MKQTFSKPFPDLFIYLEDIVMFAMSMSWQEPIMKEIDLRNATLYDPDAEKARETEPDFIPPEAYGRRVRVIHINNRSGVTVGRIRLVTKVIRNLVGEDIEVVHGYALSGQPCVMAKGPEGKLVMGEGCVSVTHRTARMVRSAIRANGKLDVVV